jgi:RES domain-containing protein
MTELAGFRVASWDTPLRVNPNRNAGRWNRAGQGVTQYIALHPLATWAEYLRWHGVRDETSAMQHRLGVWAIRVIADDLLILDFDNAQDLGLQPADLVADDWQPCQQVAERLRHDPGAPKLLQVPSAALPGARNLVILEERIAIPYSQEPIEPIDTPVTLAAAGARPPGSLIELVRHRGDPHAELQAWEAGVPYRLVEPSDGLLADQAAD